MNYSMTIAYESLISLVNLSGRENEGSRLKVVGVRYREKERETIDPPIIHLSAPLFLLLLLTV